MGILAELSVFSRYAIATIALRGLWGCLAL